MRKLSDLAKDFYEHERPEGILLSDEQILALATASVRFYAGFCPLLTHQKVAEDEQTQTEGLEIVEKDPISVIGGDTELTVGEWSIIRPLFLLYCERETALHLEASRGLGADPYGRSSSEIAGDISQYEAEMSHKAFVHPCITV